MLEEEVQKLRKLVDENNPEIKEKLRIKVDCSRLTTIRVDGIKQLENDIE